ncbi:MAG: hypothetical protein ACF8GE_04145 [Phycisphaerales bacterium JB043]
MRVFLDDTELTTEAQTLGSALEAGRVEAGERRRVIVEVWADGERTSDEEISSPPEFAPYADEIKMVSVDPRALVTTTLYDASDAMVEVRRMQEEASEAIQRGETTESLRRVQDVLGVWESARRAIDHGCALLGVAPSELLGDQDRFDASVDRLKETLRSLVEDAQHDDWVGVGDTLDDELAKLAEEWQAMLCDLGDTIGRRGDEGT